MSRPVIFDLFHTLVHGADDERDRVVGEMALVVGVAPSALIAAYHATWRDRLVRWDVEETVRILAGRLGGTPTDAQVTRAGGHRRALARRVLGTVSTATLDVLDALRDDGRPLALISNATSETAEAWPQSPLARCFDVAVFSCEVGCQAPTRRSTASPLALATRWQNASLSVTAQTANWPRGISRYAPCFVPLCPTTPHPSCDLRSPPSLPARSAVSVCRSKFRFNL